MMINALKWSIKKEYLLFTNVQPKKMVSLDRGIRNFRR